MTITADVPAGELVRQWRERRRRSQLDVSIAADVSSRHLSFIETGRSRPSSEMIERICDELEVPLRDRNRIQLAAGFAPTHPERPLTDLGEVGTAVDAILQGHEPYPALAINVTWDLLAANDSAWAVLGNVPATFLEPPINVLRSTLHPDGLASQIGNYRQWRDLVVRRVRAQLDRTAAPELVGLIDDLESYPVPPGGTELDDPGGPVVPMLLNTELGPIRLLYTLTVFGAPRDVTMDEIAIESFFPADAQTREALQRLARHSAANSP